MVTARGAHGLMGRIREVFAKEVDRYGEARSASIDSCSKDSAGKTTVAVKIGMFACDSKNQFLKIVKQRLLKLKLPAKVISALCRT
ncbi:hypothetical protein OESDEN_14620 [Oesophagostomum dentatum]|uniref:Uncharacterized protein n=1 Tax=Oesophagostomum dentatum TaxID=61180 RepID=A0A0B1SL77_OESDE|nr:hypothetical protein OESDEN_14620 [Oesophagostomum dentatum]